MLFKMTIYLGNRNSKERYTLKSTEKVGGGFVTEEKWMALSFGN